MTRTYEQACLHCRQPLTRPPGRGTGVKKYCSTKCKDDARNAARRTHAPVTCPECSEVRTLINPTLAGRMCRGCAAAIGSTAAVIANTRPPTDRFMEKVKLNPNGCWEWHGTRQANGYGAFGQAGRTLRAHRWSYEHFVGPIPPGLEIDHLCRNRGCVNPAHLEPVTRAVNMQRAREARNGS